jgi:hypothetical protein
MSKKQVWKYPITPTERQSLKMPDGAEILDVQVQRGSTCLWALVDGERPKVTRHFVMVGTGHEIPEQDYGVWRVYVGTFQLAGGDLVFHLFEDVAS